MKNKISTPNKLMIALLAGILSIQLLGALQVDRMIYAEINGILMSQQYKIWCWDK